MSNKKLRILCWLDSPLAGTGFGIVAKNVITSLSNTGKYDIYQLAINHHGEFHDGDKFPWQMQPARLLDPKDPHGMKMFHKTLVERHYDIVWICNDLFVTTKVAGIISEIKDLWAKRGEKPPVFIYYYPVDCAVIHNGADFLDVCDIPVCYTEHGKQETLKVKPHLKDKLLKIPHGVDTSIFFPADRLNQERWRNNLFKCDPDTTIVLNVNRNSTRKQLPYSILAFKEFKQYVPNSIMYIHSMIRDQGGDMQRAVEDAGLDISKDVIFPVKFSPSKPFSDALMHQIYNIADIFLSTHLGEGWGLCLHPSTILDTTRGSIPIKNVMVGDNILGGDGLFHKVLDTTTRTVNELYTVRAMYSPPITTTQEHPFFVLKNGDSSPSWVNVKDITINDYIAIPKTKEKEPLVETIDVLDFITDEVEYDNNFVWYKMGYSPKTNGISIQDIQNMFQVSKRVAEDARNCFLNRSLPSRGLPGSLAYSIAEKIKQQNLTVNTQQLKIKRHIPINKEFLYFLGWYLAEGSNGNQSRIELDFNSSELFFAHDLSSYLNKTFNVKSVVEQQSPNKCRVRLSGQVISKFFGNICGEGAINKKIPSFLLRSPQHLGLLLKGLFLGDGHLEHRTYSLSTISPSLAFQCRYICSAMDILISVKKSKRIENGNHSIYTCSVSTPCISKWIQFTDDNNYFPKVNRKPAQHFIEDNNFFYVKVTGILLEEKDNQVVHDICVDKIHSFTANGLLAHNTITEAIACGVPVVTGNNTCMSEHFGENSERGYMYECNDIAWIDSSGFRKKGLIPDIVNQMLLANQEGPKSSNPKCQEALKWVRQYDWNIVNKKWIDLFEKVSYQIHHSGPISVMEEV